MAYILKTNKQEKIKLIITKGVQAKLRYLCKKIPNNEWSGILFYDVVEGSIKEPEKMVIKTLDFLPLDKGSGTFTSVDFDDEKVVSKFGSYVMNNEHLQGVGYGITHSHVNFGVFFSNTDTTALEETTELLGFFLSLIVNNANDAIAKVGHITYASNLRAKDERGNPYELDTNTYKVFNSYDCIIEIEEDELPQDFIDIVKELNKIPEIKEWNYRNYGDYRGFEVYEQDNNQIKVNTTKTTNNLWDTPINNKEFNKKFKNEFSKDNKKAEVNTLIDKNQIDYNSIMEDSDGFLTHLLDIDNDYPYTIDIAFDNLVKLNVESNEIIDYIKSKFNTTIHHFFIQDIMNDRDKLNFLIECCIEILEEALADTYNFQKKVLIFDVLNFFKNIYNGKKER